MNPEIEGRSCTRPKLQKDEFLTVPLGAFLTVHQRYPLTVQCGKGNGTVRASRIVLERLFRQMRTRVHDPVLAALRGPGRLRGNDDENCFG